MEAVYAEDAGILSIMKGFESQVSNRPGLNKRSRFLSGSFFEFYDAIEEEMKAQAELGSAFQVLEKMNDKDIFNSSSSSVVKGCGLLRSQSFPLEGSVKAARRRAVNMTRSGSISMTIEVQGQSVERDECSKDSGLRMCAETSALHASASFASFEEVKKQTCSDIETMVVESETHIRTLLRSEDKQHSERLVLVEHESHIQTVLGSKEQQKQSEKQTMLMDGERCIRTVLDSKEKAERGNFSASVGCSTNVVLPCDVEKASCSGFTLGSGSLLAYGKCPPCGKLLVCGRRREMEDTVAIVPSFAALSVEETESCFDRNQSHLDLHFFGVYDGHGGSQASSYCMDKLHLLLAEELKGHFFGDSAIRSVDTCRAKWESVLRSCFMKMDKEVGGVCSDGICDDDLTEMVCSSCDNAIAPGNVGTTALVVVISSAHIIVANCGDSRAVLYRGGNVIPLSTDHKPERADETSRIEAAGGRVIFWDGYRVGGLLALSRAIGDRYLKRYIISEPEVMCMERSKDDEFIILASDGLWAVIGNDYACKVARKSLLSARRKREVSILSSSAEDPASVTAASLLVKLAFNKGSRDNISVVVVDLNLSDRLLL